MGQGDGADGMAGSKGEDAAGASRSASASAAEDRSWEQMALFLDEMPENAEDNPDLAALQALQYDDYTPEEVAESLKEQGNRLLKQGRRFYREAQKLYTQAIAQNSSINANNSAYYANRAHVNLLLGNSRRAFEDSVQAVKHNPDNVKAYFRAAKAALALGVLDGAADSCKKGLAKDPSNGDLQKLQKTIEERRSEKELQARKNAEARAAAEKLVSALSRRKVKLGPEAFREWTGGRRPWMDVDGLLHFPVVLLYGEVMMADLIEDFCEMNQFSDHLDQMFGKGAPPLEWDERREYTRERVELYFQTNAHRTLSKSERIAFFMEGQEGTGGDGSGCTKEEERVERLDLLEKRWVKVDEKMTLASVLAKAGHVIPGAPVFFVVAWGTRFKEMLVTNEWLPP